MNRTLTLRRETLSDLTPAELGGVVGGNYTSPNGISCGVRDCVDTYYPDRLTHVSDQLVDAVSRMVACYSALCAAGG